MAQNCFNGYRLGVLRMKLTIETECPDCNLPATSIIHFLGKDMKFKLQLEEISMFTFYCSYCGDYLSVNEIVTYVEED